MAAGTCREGGGTCWHPCGTGRPFGKQVVVARACSARGRVASGTCEAGGGFWYLRISWKVVKQGEAANTCVVGGGC